MKKLKLFEEYTGGIENESRLSEKILKLLNEQIKNELQSSQIYRAMSCWLDDKGWVDASKYYFNASDEELVHMKKIYEYIFDKNALAKVPTCDESKQEFKDIKEILNESLKHEMDVTKQWNEIADSSLEEKDNDTYALSQWFLKEQVEEESKFRDIIFKTNLDMPKYEIDLLFKK